MGHMDNLRITEIMEVPTPCYIIDERLLIKNLETLKGVQERTGCHILLAQKGFSMFSLYGLIGKYLKGTTASGLFEARLGYEEMGGEVHVFSPAYREHEFDELLKICDHIIFNSFYQWRKYKEKVQRAPQAISCGIRVNPEYSEQEHAIYDPAAPGSRLGVTEKNFEPDALTGIEGLHFHTLCEQDASALVNTVRVFDEKFGKYMGQMKWLNLGGGHHITRPGYDLATLEECLISLKEKYGVEVYLEPGEAVVLNAGYLVSEVLDFVRNEIDIAILDASAACHMPDVLEMPYRPNIIGAGHPGEKAYSYRLGGPTCLAGDIIGDYSFDQPLKVGDKLVFCDMAHYTMVKNNTFNGVNLPSIAVFNEREGVRIIKSFGYEDFKNRLS
jgi:carboxynorspermidine decarboxylase